MSDQRILTSVLKLTCAVGFFACCNLPSIVAHGADRPNVVLVMADDQGWGDMAYNGHPVVKTPHFDAAAAAGLQFERFYAAAPVCSPTRASVLTGRHPNRSGVFKWGYPLRPQEITLAEQLRRVGYQTAHFGKWHLGSVRPNSPVHPGKQGFTHWLSAPNFYDNDPVLSRMGVAVQCHGESSLLVARHALEWMRPLVNQSQPFLAVVWFGSPHAPHRASDDYQSLYTGHDDANFLGEISAMDQAFGLIRMGLENLGVKNNTVLWYCSDNGALPNVGSTGGFRGQKGSVYEGGLLVPAIVEWPARISAHRKTMVRCSTSDILPTVCELADAALPNRPLDGVSLVPLLGGDMTARPKPQGFWDYRTRGIGVPSAKFMAELLTAQSEDRDVPPYAPCLTCHELPQTPYSTDRFEGHAAWLDGDWKLHRIETPTTEGTTVRWELYDLARDPREQHDRSSNEQRRATMEAALTGWLASVVHSLNGQDY